MLILSFTVHEVLPIQSKKVIAFLLAKIHLNPGYLILGYKERGCGFSKKNSKYEFRYESFKNKFIWIPFVYNLVI